jgi:tetratricopeptide (TPR) repeat protein
VPVWHELTREARAAGELVVIGITQEQHPDRCELYAQWQGLDWPILWDPFNLTGSKAVPNAIAIDEHGVVRSVGLRAKDFESKFMFVDFEPLAGGAAERVATCAYGDLHGKPLGPVEWGMRGKAGKAIDALEELLLANPEDARLSFRAGVARRMRYDSVAHQPEDFQIAVDHWTQALALDPNQYIWRRRIQQYGPRMDKPYPFYSWIEQARAQLKAKGKVPVALVAGLTPAELAQPRRGKAVEASSESKEADPEGRIDRDTQGFIQIETAVAFDTSKGRDVGSVHLGFRPSVERLAHWNHESGVALEVWLQAPEGWKLSARHLTSELVTKSATSSELVQLSGEVTLPADCEEGVLRGYALYYVCEGEAGTCLYLRQDFEVEILRPE